MQNKIEEIRIHYSHTALKPILITVYRVHTTHDYTTNLEKHNTYLAALSDNFVNDRDNGLIRIIKVGA